MNTMTRDVITTTEDNCSAGICAFRHSMEPVKGLSTRVLYGCTLCPSTTKPPVVATKNTYLEVRIRALIEEKYR